MKKKITIIRIRRGNENARYIVCDNAGSPIRGFQKLSDIRKHWQREIKWGYVELIRELDRKPEMAYIEHTIKCLNAILAGYAKQ